jgi:hypothetical protein
MRLSRSALALAAALGVSVVLAVLLSPLGFESRPSSHLKIVGFVAIGAVFAGTIIDLVSIVLLFRRVRLASTLAIVGSILFVFPNVADRTGSFFSLPIPPVINTLEYAHMAVLLVTLLLAWRVHARSGPSPS